MMTCVVINKKLPVSTTKLKSSPPGAAESPTMAKTGTHNRKPAHQTKKS